MQHHLAVADTPAAEEALLQANYAMPRPTALNRKNPE
jgi:hypothetical protein